jgi:hypothetical protein
VWALIQKLHLKIRGCAQGHFILCYFLTFLFYHSLLVGFCVLLWVRNTVLIKLLIACYRCVFTEANNKPDVILKQSISDVSDRTSTDASFSGKVSVSVADDGETALVVSMVGVNSESKSGLLEGSLSSKTAQEGFYCNSYPSYSKDNLSHDVATNGSILRNKDSSCKSHVKSLEINHAGMVSSDPTERSSELSPIHESACSLFGSEHDNLLNEGLEIPQHVSSYSLLCGNEEAESTGEETALPRNSNAKSPVIKSAQLSSAGMFGNLHVLAQYLRVSYFKLMRD